MAGKRSSGERHGSVPKASALESRLKAMKQEFLELKETLQRVQADFENAMKRKEKEISIREQRARAGILKSFLPVLDSVEEALKHSSEPGLKQLREQLFQLLKAMVFQ